MSLALLGDRLEEIARARKDAIAIVDGQSRMSYRELLLRADALAKELEVRGIGPRDLVGVALPRSAELIVAVVGVVRAGAAYVPIDINHPAERRTRILSDAHPKLIVTKNAQIDGIPSGIEVLQLPQNVREGIERRRRPGDGDPVYVIYTSGTTGQPKGVVVTQRNLARLFTIAEPLFKFGANDVWTLFHSIAFDFSVWELWGALLHGGRLLIVPALTARAADEFHALVRREQVTVLSQTPSAFRAFDAADAAAGRPANQLRHVVLGGEALDPRSLKGWFESHGDGQPRLANMYGITETTVHVTYRRMLARDAYGLGESLIGAPLGDLRIDLLGPDGRPVMTGEIGEIFVGGEGVSAGYLGSPELTAERFLPDPRGEHPNTRLYRSGDLGRRMPDGDLEYLGRVDDQVKLRGFRIELGEIEARLAEHPAVRQAVVLAREDTPGDKRLVAYYTGEPNIGAKALRTHVLAALPEYMAPAAYVNLERLPLTPNGKLDRKALPAPGGEAYGARGFETPVGAMEETHAQIGTKVFNAKLARRRYDLGGYPLIDKAGKPFHARPERFFALTAPQIPIWVDQSLYPQKPIYNTGQTLLLRTAVDIGRFVAALERVVAENDALRIRLVERDSDILQYAVNDVSVHLEFGDFSVDKDPEAAAGAWIEQLFRKPFGATDFPLFQFALAKLAADRFLWLKKYHHLIMDATGRRLVAARVAAVYDAISAGVEPPAIDNGPYLGLAEAADDQYLASGSWAADEEYWRTRLADLPEPVVQVDARLSEKSRSGRPTQLTWELSLEASEALREFAKSQGSSVNKVFLALIWCCLTRLYGRSDLILGVPVANRKGADTRRTVGQFAKVMPFRTRLNPAMTLAAALSALDTDLSKDLEHQRFPFHYLPHRRGPDGVCDVIVNFQRNDYGFSLGGASVTCANVSVGFAVPLSITSFEHRADDAIHIVIAYDPGRISSEEVTRFLKCFQELLRRAPKAAEIAVGRLPMVSVEERAALIRRAQGQRVALPESATLPVLLAQQAARSPNATALVCGEERLTYAELHACADRLARRLVALGVGPETLVGICLPRTIVLIVAILAVHKAGGAYLPLDPSYPQHRLVFMVEDSNTRFVLTDLASSALLTRTSAQLLRLDESPEDARELSVLQPGNGVKPGDLAYVLYTSGSTGNPKGIAVTHGGAVNLVLSSRSLVSTEDVSGVLFATSLNFDISVYEIFLPLACGGAIIMVDNLFGLTTAPARDEVRLVNTVPSLMAAFLKEGSLPVGVRLVNLAGEALPRSLADRIFANRTNVRLFNLYGPTETTVYSTWSAVDRNDRRSPPIGVPLFNTEVYLLDEFLQPVPEGCIGELWIGGMGVSRGYLNLAQLTQQRFIPNPFAEGRIYKTGDLAAWLSDGQLGFAGRMDHQVKIRGCRIELGEIESVLKLHPAVRESMVVAREDASSDERLVAYVTPEGSSAIPINELRSLLMQRLPAYMVPSAFVLLDAFPISPNGKLDRNALLAPNLTTPESLRSNVAPRTPTERVLAGIWCEVLNLKQVGVYDDFFEYGGHSLLAMRIVSRILNIWSVGLSLRTFFENPTISSLADQIENLLGAMKGTGGDLGSRELLVQGQPIPAADRGEPLVLSYAQQRLWFLAQLEGASEAYHIPLDVRLRGRLDRDALRRALDRLVARHEALRTTFNLFDGQPVQRIASADCGFALAEHDLRRHANGESELQRLIEAEATTPFDLEHGPPIRGRLVRLAEHEHALLITMHHIVSDGWSIGLVIEELSKLYASFRRSEADPLPALPIQYADYAAWQRCWLQGRQRQVEYWKAALSGAPVLLELPTDRPRPPQQDFAGALVKVALDGGLTQRLKALSQRHGVTLFMTLLAAWAALLTRLSGQQEVVIGSVTANRTRTEIEPLIGFFVNTLALRIDVSGTPTASELLARVKALALSAQEHQDIPFEQVVEAVQPPRSLAHSPLFQVMFAWQNAPQGDFELPGLRVSPIAPSHVTAKFDLLLSLEEESEEIAGGLEYATALFDRETVERYLSYWRNLLEAIAADDTQKIDRLPLLSETERHKLLVEWNATDAEYPRDKCVHELFEAQAAKTPEAVAVVFGDRHPTYAELNSQANRLAHHLRQVGVNPDARVAICVERSLDMIVGLLAILKASGAYVPLDSAYPPERLAYMLQDSTPVALLTHAAAKAALQPHVVNVHVVDLEADASLWAHLPDVNPDPATLGLKSDNLAYVIYTSGSTGKPKGVAMPHASLASLTDWQIAQSALPTAAPTLQFASLSFDVSFQEIFCTLGAGGTLILLSEKQRRDPQALWDVLRRERVSRLFLPFVALQQLAQHSRNITELPESLVEVVTAGEQLQITPPIVALFKRLGAMLCNQYGPTETHVVTQLKLTGPPSKWQTCPTLGHPIANSRIYILDANLEPTPVGVTGEIYIGGAGVARGYLNRPELTAERFLPDSFAREPNTRMYKTGDLGRWLADGVVEFLGRNDFQVKIRGFRIELGEIEARLAEHPAVRQAVVLAREDTPGDKRLVAYYTGEPNIGAKALRTHVLAALPEYMVPSAFVLLDAFPISPNGKLDRNALLAPNLTTPESLRSNVAPRTPTERVLAGIWCEVLNLKQVGVYDDFFEYGGHSLLAMRIVSRILNIWSVGLSLRTFFENPTISSLADQIENLLGAMKGTGGDLGSRELLVQGQPIPAADRGEPLVLSYAQQRLWFLAQLEGASEAYHIPLDVRLRGRLDRDALRRALDRLVARHEALRTTFNLFDGQPVQRIASADCGFALAEHDLRRHANGESELQRLIEAEATTPFDLEHGPPIRGRLVRLAEHEHALLITMHHIVSDGWSIGLVIEELSKLYASFRRSEADPLPALPIQYADYAAWQRCWLQGRQRQVEYWKAALSGAPVLLELPTDRPRPPQQDFAGALVKVALDGGLTQRLKALSQRHGVTLFMTLLAAWAALLTRLSGQQEVVIGSVTANRTRTEIEPLIGFFVNTLALRIDVSGTPTASELLARVKALALSAQEHQDIPFEQVVEAVQPPRSLAHSPLFQVMFAWQNAPQGDFELPGLRVSPIAPSHVTAKFDLLLSLEEESEEIAGGLEYATALFDRETVERYLSYWRNLLEAIAADDTQKIDRLPLLSETERHKLLVEWNATDAEYPRDKCVHELFEAQAAKTPGAIAVEHHDRLVTYAELNARASRLARRLRTLGVRPGDCVPIFLERSVDLVAAELAVLKSGAAYVPIDPTFPAERQIFMVADCGAKLVISADGIKLPEGLAATRLDINEQMLSKGEAGNLATPLDGETTAYVMYTSGSTGRPKGVMIPHRAIGRLVLNGKYVKLDAGDRVAFAANPAFDATTFEVWAPLLNGGRLVAIDQEALLEPDRFGQSLKRHSVSVLWLTVGLFNQYADVLAEEFSRLRYLLVGGDALDPRVIARVMRNNPPQHLINGYGPTETTTFAITHEITSVPEGASSIPLGRPITNTRIYILDANLEPTPVGVTGEIYIGGAGVARGYLNRPELTAERFLPDLFAREPNTRMYKTGDLGRWLADGVVEFLGRNDFQVKIRGFRIELGEIEARLAEHPAVRQAVVLAREDTPGDKRLVAYYTGEPNIGAKALRTHVLAALPEYMAPAAYVNLERLPLTPNGKLDRKALPAPGADAYGAPSYEAPVGLVEKTIAQIWAEVLKTERVGRRDNFFDLGGHSLMGVRLIDKVNRTLNVSFGISELFQNPTVERMAKVIHHDSSVSRSTYPAGVVEIRKGTTDRPLFCLPGLRGTAFQFRILSAKVDTSRAILGIELHDLKVVPSVFKSMERIAEVVVQRMRQVQPVGPYTILGFSFGGNLAVEVARQLTADNQALEAVMIFDAHAPGSLRSPVGFRKLATHLRIIKRLNFHESYAYISSRIQRRLFRRAPPLPKGAIERRIVEVSNDCRDAFHAHHPKAFSGRIVLLRATDADDWMEVADPSGTCGWSDICRGGVDVISMACRHLDIIKEPNVTILAGHINDLLNAIDRDRCDANPLGHSGSHAGPSRREA